MSTLPSAATAAVFFFLLACAHLSASQTPALPTLYAYSPTSGPTVGGTVIRINGSGFYPSGTLNSVCYFDSTSPSGSTMGVTNVPSSNATNITCILPYINYTVTSSTSFTIYVRNGQGNEYTTSKQQFLFFNLSIINVTSVSPNEGYNLSSTTIQVRGTGFVATGMISCIVDTATNVPCNYVNSTLITCILPRYPITARRTLRITLNGDATGAIPPATPNATQFTFFYPAPQATSCSFSPSYASLLLQFDRAVEVGGEAAPLTPAQPNCSVVFDDATMVALGTDATCTWHNSEQWVLVVNLAPTSNVNLTTNITFRGNSIRTRYVSFSKLVKQTLRVTQPSVKLVPIAVLQGPGSIPSCGNLTLSAEYSLNSGYKPMQYWWTIHPKATNYTGDLAFSSSSAQISIPSASLSPSEPYMVQLTARNFLGYNDTTSALLAWETRSAPLVTILGGKTRVVSADQEVVLVGQAGIPCPAALLSGALAYHWDITASSAGPGVQLTMPNSPHIVIAPRTLQAGVTYTVKLTAGYGSSMGSASTDLVVTPARIRALIDGGSRRVVCASDDLLLNGAISVGLESVNVMVSWDCMMISTYPDGGMNETDCSDGVFNLLNVAVPKIPGGTLQTGVYRFVLTLQRDTEESSWIQDVTVVQQRVPTVLVTPPPNGDAALTSEEMIINATIASALPGTARWTNVYIQGVPPFDPQNYISPVNYTIVPPGSPQTTTPLYISNGSVQLANQLSLALRRGSLLPNGNRYTFRLEVTDSANNTGFAETDIYTGGVPTSGAMAIVPPTAGNTGPNPVQTLQAAQWLDAPAYLPLSYQFGMYCGNSTYLLSGTLSQSYLNVVLPPLNNLTLFVRVYNTLGAYTEYKVATNGAQYLNFNATALLDNASSLCLQQGNCADGLALVATLAAAMNEAPLLFRNLTSLRQNALQLALSVTLPATKAFLNFQLSVVTALTSGALLPVSTYSSAVNFLEVVVSSYNSLDSPSSKQGFSSEEADMVLRCYGNLLGANFNVSGERVKSNVVSFSLTKNINAIGYGLCKQLGLYQEAKTLDIGGFGVLKASLTNLESGYETQCSGNICGKSAVIVNFSSNLSQRYRNWTCTSDTTTSCSGVCVVAAQLNRNFRWNGSNYAWITRSSLATVTLLNQAVGKELSVSFPATSALIRIVLPITTSNPNSLQCGYWNETLANWSTQGCNLASVADGLATCNCTHLSQFAVVQVCPSGYYGENCGSVCPLGLWGAECQSECTCSNHGNCVPSNGVCICDPGWTGTSCNAACVGTWGNQCANKCQCMNGATCDPVTGYCNCTAGWLGTTCDTACPIGTYGRGCKQVCQCRTVQQCNKTTGVCTCGVGYTGTFCNATCPSLWYGVDCQQRCQCYVAGTAICGRFDGRCNCGAGWTGTLCDAKIPEPLVVQPFPTAAVVVPLLVVALVLAVTIVTIVVMVKNKKKWRKKVYPVTGEGEGSKGLLKEGIPMKTIVGGKVAIGGEGGDGGSSEGSDTFLDMTRAHSLDVLVPQGAKLKDLFPSGPKGEEFKEPPTMNGRLRWQIVQLTDSTKEDTPIKGKKKDPSPGQPQKPATEAGKEGEEHGTQEGSKEEGMEEVLYRRGVYLAPTATLRDLRNGFVETRQTSLEHRMFLFLRSDILGDHFDISSEEGTRLAYIQGSLVQPQTVYIQSLPRNVCQVDQCPCGRYAEMECSICGRRGYCGVQCQKEDWTSHIPECTGVSKKKKKKAGREYTPNVNTCVCGKEADFECSVCGRQGYCSEACQQKDWKLHVHYCKKESLDGVGQSDSSSKELKDNKGLSPILEEPKEKTSLLSSGDSVAVSAGGVAAGGVASAVVPQDNMGPSGDGGGGGGGAQSNAPGGLVTVPLAPGNQSSVPGTSEPSQVDQKDSAQEGHHVTTEAMPTVTTPPPRTAAMPEGAVVTAAKDGTISADVALKQEDQSVKT